MCTIGPNNNLCSVTEAAGMGTYCCDMPNDSNFEFVWAIEGVVGPHGTKMKNCRFVVMVILKIKIAVFTCLLSNSGCNSFPEHLDLALTHNKTNEGVKKQ